MSDSCTCSAGRPLGRRGFTVVEMLIVMGILGMMTTAAVANFRTSEYSDELRYAARNLAAEIRRAQSLSVVGSPLRHCREAGALNGQPCSGEGECGDDGLCVLDTPRGGYGLRLDSAGETRSAFLFADTGDAARSGASDRRYQDFELIRRLDFAAGQNVEVTAVSPDDGNGLLDIVFTAPRPIAWFNGQNDQPVATVTLTHVRTGSSRTVRLNGVSGQVSVE